MTPIETLSPSIELCLNNELPILKITHPTAEAKLSLHGGHLLQFKPAGHKDIIWLSEQAQFSTNAAIRGGVPICWPWFGRIAQPSHGFARTSLWQLMDHQESHDGVIIRLLLEDNEYTRTFWPHAFKAILTFTIGVTLTIDLDIQNTGQQPWRFSGALHTYFHLGDAPSSYITGMGPKYLDSLNHNKRTTGETQLPINQAIDRVYLAPEASIHIHDTDHQRIIQVENRGHNAAVIWNPWQEGAEGMNDMTNEGYKTMACVESTWFAKDLASGLEVQPGQNHHLSTKISIQ